MIPGNRWDLLDGLQPDPLPRVSVVVPHYRQQSELDRTLLALARQDYPPALIEVIVVDDGSPQPPRVPSGVRLLRQSDLGFRLAAARNLGAAHATGEVLCFLDADTAPEPGYLRALTRLPALCPEAVTVGRRRHADFGAVAPDAAVQEAGPAHELAEPGWLREGYRASADLLHADDRSYRYVIGAVTACSRAFFETVGGYDESFTSYGGEDWEWAYRAWLAGAVFAHVPSAVAWHDGPEWAGRDASALEDRNAEALRLAELIPVPGSRPRGLRPEHADIVLTVAPELTGTERFLAIDSALASLPEADAAPRWTDRVRIEVELLSPLRVHGPALRTAVERVAAEGLGSLTAADADGRPLLRVRSRRAAAREWRHPGPALFPHPTEQVAGIEAVTTTPSLEAYLGGWDSTE
ncbi:glycosyltransferase [Microbacteriaceae bacterium VKM Ac-2854]|nr:glycosyltransferase [Microbacteriaceae bacterium VKM Ac-2854]